jgi:hypothetical protein
LNSDQFAKNDILLADRIEDSDSSTQNRTVVHGIDISGDTDYGFGAEKYILSISPITCDAVDCLVLTHLEEAALA